MASSVIKGAKTMLLAEITSTVETVYTVSDSIANYRFVILYIIPSVSNRQILNSSFLPVDVFKTMALQADYQNLYNAYCKYLSNTSIRGSVKSEGQIGRLYGIS